MIKVSLFQGSEEFGPAAVPLFGPADPYFEKVASASLLPEVSTYIADLKPKSDSQYVLVNAMGAGEYYGSNINGDRFSEAALVHAPDRWQGVPLHDAALAKGWDYGFPTFYDACVFPHHRNKDKSKKLGVVELAAWNPHMKRVELITRLDKEDCLKHGGESIWDKLKSGSYPDVSMGTKVPFDTCSITLDRKRYQEAWDSYDSKRHSSPGAAILEVHKKHPIRGVQVTRKEYSEYGRTMMNRILPDGRKVWVDNDFPRFFDISYVFIGADKIAKAMLKIADAGKRVYGFMGSAEVAEKMASGEDVLEKNASAESTPKQAEMTKRVVPNAHAGKAVPMLTEREDDFPRELQDVLGKAGLGKALATTTGLGMVLRPREFQRITLVSMGKGDLADQFEALGHGFPKSDEKDGKELKQHDFSPVLAQLLAPFMDERSAFGPVIERRVLVIAGVPAKSTKTASSHPSDLLRKIGSAYNSYRANLMQFVANAQDMIEAATPAADVVLRKYASVSAEELFTPLSFKYLTSAFMNELPVGYSQQGVVKLSGDQAHAGVQRAHPLVTTR
jgi:hypothetical protein